MNEASTSVVEYDIESTQDGGEVKFICRPTWIDKFETKGVRDFRLLLEEFVEQFLNINGLLPSVSRMFVAVLQSYGVLITCETKSKIRGIDSIPVRKLRQRSNIDEMLRKISSITDQLNMTQFLKNSLLKTGTGNVGSVASTIVSNRLDLWYLSYSDYEIGLELKLSSLGLLRELHSRKRMVEFQNAKVLHSKQDRTISTLLVHYTFSALQVAIRKIKSPLSFVGDQIIQLSHSHIVKMRHLQFESDLLGHLNELLICSLALDQRNVQEELCEMEGLIRKKSSQYFIPWNAWSIVSRYERNLGTSNPAAFIIDATRLADSVSDDEISQKSVVFVEEACKIWKNCHTYEHEILSIITEFTKTHPQNGPRMLELAKFCNISYEIDALIQDMCGGVDEKLHPANEIWLIWIERKLNNVNRFGDIESNIRSCLTAIFNFLDYDSNKFSQKAWELIHKTVQVARPQMVYEEWEMRRKWWPRFHRNSYNFSLKTEVLDALEQLNSSSCFS